MHTEYLIIGGGISGLSFASACSGDYLLIEKENEVGGYCRTIKRGDYVWDYAGHFFHFKDESLKKSFLDNMDNDRIVYNKKCTKILFKDLFVDYPFQANIHMLPQDDFIDCLYDLYFKEEKENYDSFLDMLYGKFGTSITEKFLRPYNEKLYACELSSLDRDAMGRFFPYADLTAIIKNMKDSELSSYNADFLYPRDGAGAFIDVLHKRLDPSRVLTNTAVSKIFPEEKRILLSDGNSVSYDYLINTAPLNRFLEMLNNKQMEFLANELSYNKVLVFNLGFEKKGPLTDEHWMYVPSKTANYYRVGFYDNILGDDKLSMYVEIGFAKNDEINELTVEKQLELTLENLVSDGFLQADNSLCDYEVIIMDPAYVHISTDTDSKIKDLKKELAELGIFTIGRYGGWTYCSMEDCMHEATSLSSMLK